MSNDKPIFDELLEDPDAWLGDARDVPPVKTVEFATSTPRHISEAICRVVEAIR